MTPALSASAATIVTLNLYVRLLAAQLTVAAGGALPPACESLGGVAGMGNPMVGASVASGSEEAQRSFDSPCRKLHRFLSQPPGPEPGQLPTDSPDEANSIY